MVALLNVRVKLVQDKNSCDVYIAKLLVQTKQHTSVHTC